MRDRPLWQIAGIYLGAGWIVLQVVDVLSQNLDLPSTVFAWTLVFLGLGFPMVMLTATLQRRLAGEGTEGGSGIIRFFTWRNAVIGGATAFGSLALATVLAMGFRAWLGQSGTGPDTSVGENSLVVLPFAFQGNPDHAYLGDGIVDLLSTKMDGAGDIRAVDPRAVLSLVTREGSPSLGPSEAATLAQELGSRLFIMGSIIEVGDRLTITAALYDPRRGTEPLAEASAAGETAGIFESVDELATQLLGGVASGPAARVRQVAAVSTGSLPALRAYLEGEQAYRRGQYREAVSAFQRAVEIDPTYAMAYYRLSVVAEFSTLSDLAQESAELAYRNADRLSERDQGLLQAFLAWRRGEHGDAEQQYRHLVRTYPDEVEAWFELGEVLIHGNPLHGRSFQEAGEPFRRVLELDPANTAAMYHLARILAVESRYEELDSLVALHSRLSPGGDREVEIVALQAFSRADTALQDAALARVRAAADQGVALAGWDVTTWTDNIQGARAIMSAMADPTRPPEVQNQGYAYLTQIALAQGKATEARAHLERMESVDAATALEYRAFLMAHPAYRPSPEELDATIQGLEQLDAARVAGSGNPSGLFSVHDRIHPLLKTYLLGIAYGMRGDSALAWQRASEAESMEMGPAEGSLARDLAASVRAQFFWRSNRPEDALRELDAIEREVWYLSTLTSPVYGQVLERYLRGEILFQMGRMEEAIPWFANLSQIAPYEVAFRPLAYERLAQIHESLGDSDAALDYYRRFAEFWVEADPALQPRVGEASARIEELREAVTRPEASTSGSGGAAIR
ncbi:MAG: tetratricopeptide repeat protein [Gemmatimonadales bacterium]|jgi:tetratricopeptide (TPR) repeat protein|nr:MAG: tetratricopeptide repeat protein [Gemmatimonadales bacterium]